MFCMYFFLIMFIFVKRNTVLLKDKVNQVSSVLKCHHKVYQLCALMSTQTLHGAEINCLLFLLIF